MFGLDEMHADGMSTGLFSDEEDGYNLEEETKYKLKLDAPQSEPAFGDSGSDDLGDFEDLGDDELGGDDLGGDDKPFDDEPFDAGVEADETEEPEKYIQQLSGKLGNSLRQYSDERGEPDFDLEKFAINSVISATHTSDMDVEDQKDIISKVKSSGADDDFGAEDELGGDELGGDELGGEDLGGEDLGGEDFGDDLEEVAVRDYEAEEEANKPNLRVYGQNPNAEKYVKEDGFELNELTDLNISEKNDIFTENMNIVDYIKNKVQELMDTETEPIVKPDVAPVETPSPRRKRIWEAKPLVQPKPKAEK